ncbi:hypothetical protein HZH66_010246 [Vespula vulgaris]|uniref:Uncharacterized protein n=1 Tax=Vespula vulgaris TaxID=7454 RepID=A0A834JIY6_VESVU|nr:hypothetical protein HZH66_010246 [Vespula vulgaris]
MQMETTKIQLSPKEASVKDVLPKRCTTQEDTMEKLRRYYVREVTAARREAVVLNKDNERIDVCEENIPSSDTLRSILTTLICADESLDRRFQGSVTALSVDVSLNDVQILAKSVSDDLNDYAVNGLSRKKRSCEKTQLHLFQGINRRSGKQVARGMRHNVLSRGGHEVAVGKSPPGRGEWFSSLSSEARSHLEHSSNGNVLPLAAATPLALRLLTTSGPPGGVREEALLTSRNLEEKGIKGIFDVDLPPPEGT